ncbi:unnamed protein product [Clonostachys solani]|uniref:Uncharacterized protein n=1 Tax=Clonostachys solani TaxID=160281 RepID=A0A9N9ZKY9_9HYPO|nr:unnamed protein product [Clonostachys solani]
MSPDVSTGLGPIIESLVCLKRLNYEPWQGVMDTNVPGSDIRDQEHAHLLLDAFESRSSTLKQRHKRSQGFVLTGSDSTTQWDADVTNPSASALCHIDLPPSKGVVLAYRGCRYNCSGAPDSELINIAVAEEFRGPYVKLQEAPIFTEANDDPFIWRDKGGHYHMLLHSLELGGGFGEGPKVGRHAFARYFWGPWTFNERTLAFSTEVDWTDGTSTDFFRRERPYLLFSDDGLMTPQYLITAVKKYGTNKGYSIVSPLKGEHTVTAKKHKFAKKEEEHVREL